MAPAPEEYRYQRISKEFPTVRRVQAWLIPVDSRPEIDPKTGDMIGTMPEIITYSLSQIMEEKLGGSDEDGRELTGKVNQLVEEVVGIAFADNPRDFNENMAAKAALKGQTELAMMLSNRSLTGYKMPIIAVAYLVSAGCLPFYPDYKPDFKELTQVDINLSPIGSERDFAEGHLNAALHAFALEIYDREHPQE